MYEVEPRGSKSSCALPFFLFFFLLATKSETENKYLQHGESNSIIEVLPEILTMHGGGLDIKYWRRGEGLLKR